MIVLDTNVLSEALKQAPQAAVLSWLDRRSPNELFTTAITESEILYGIAILPNGKRKNVLRDSTERIFIKLFQDRILPFDSRAAQAYAELTSKRRALGRPMSQSDAQIAAVALANGASIATRNIADFEGCGITLVNPWIEE